MPSPTRRISLNVEALEVRDVPAILLQGTQIQAGPFPRPVTPNGGDVTIQEVIFSASDIVVTTQRNGNNFANADAATRTKSVNAADNITLANNGGTLTINASDGIFLRYSNNNGTFFQFVGTTIDVQNVTSLMVDLQLGGDDNVTDNTTFGTTINGGAGNDTITAAGGEVNPLVLQLLLTPGGINPALFPLLAGNNPAKTVNGRDGNDTINLAGSASNFTADGGAGNDTINGSPIGFANTLKGGDGSDVIVGGFGFDVIDGGAGFDVLFGVSGGDLYLALDGEPDFVLNQRGDANLVDPFDVTSF